MRQDNAGFIILTALISLVSMTLLTAVNLARSMTDLRVSNQTVANHQAFHFAEAGLDEAMTEFVSGNADFTEVEGWHRDDPANPCTQGAACPCVSAISCAKTLLFPDGSSRVAVDDIGAIEPTITARGITVGSQQRILVRAQRLSALGALGYTVAGSSINLDGNAKIGNPLNDQSTLYALGPPPPTGALASTAANRVYAAHIDFFNPTTLTLGQLCPNCSDPTVFIQPMTFNMDAPRAPDIRLDLKPYYQEALTQGHVIASNVTFQNANLVGVYYVECGVDVLFKGTSTVTGTIVHEGCSGDIKVAANASLSVDSTTGVQFAKGMAIVGLPDVQFGNTTSINISGVVMHHGYGSIIAATGTIEGGLMGIHKDSVVTNYPDLVSQYGPGAYNYITFELAPVHIGGSTNIIFRPLTQIIGLQGTSGLKILFWQLLD